MAKQFREDLVFGGLMTSLDEYKTPKDRAYAASNCTTDKGVIEGIPRYYQIAEKSSLSTDTAYGLGYGKYTGNEIQRVSLAYTTVTGGTFTLTFSGQTTGNIAYNATATDVQAALEALSNIGVGDVRVSGGPFPSLPFRVEFRGQYANTDAAAMTISTAGLTGSGISGTVTEEFKGGTFEQYVMVAKAQADSDATLYKITSSDGFTLGANSTVTSLGVTTLDPTAWYFQQFGRYIYGINEVDGVIRIGLGGSVVTQASRPSSPTRKPTRTYKYSWTNGNLLQFFPLTATVTDSGFSSTPTFTALGSTPKNLKVQLTANETGANVSLTITLESTKDYQFRDSGVIIFSRGDGGVQIPPNSIRVSLINNAATEIDAQAYGGELSVDAGATQFSERGFHMHDTSRADRDDVTKLKITFTISGTAGKSFYVGAYIGDNWMNDTKDLVVDNGPKQGKIEYAYSYYDVSDDLESDLSPVNQVEFPTTDRLGAYIRVNAIGSSALTTSDKIRFYRKEKSTGKWRRIPNADGSYGVANVTSGTTYVDDHYMEHELEDFPEPDIPLGFPPSGSAGTLPTAITAWKQSLVIGADRQAWFSAVNREKQFFPSPDEELPIDPQILSDPGRAVTEYVSDNRSETVSALVGQDSIYAVTPVSSYAKVGDAPALATSFRRLPGSRGAVSKRSVSRLGGGILVGSQDGLWFYSVGRGFSGDDNGALVEREETSEVRTSWGTLVASATNLIVVEHQDELWAVSGSSYMTRTRNQRWYSGTFAHSMTAAVGNRERGLMMLTGTGKIMKFSSTVTTDNGTGVSWSYATGRLIGPRSRIVRIEAIVAGSPTLTIDREDGAGGSTDPGAYTLSSSRINSLNVNVLPGYHYKFTFAGTSGTDKVYSCAVIYEDMGPGFGG